MEAIFLSKCNMHGLQVKIRILVPGRIMLMVSDSETVRDVSFNACNVMKKFGFFDFSYSLYLRLYQIG